MESRPNGMPPPAFTRALRRVLRPLVRLMLSQGVTLQYLTDLLKGLFVEVAEREFRIDDKPPTDSRISLVTGVHRKDVSRLRQELSREEDATPNVVSLGAQLVAVWLGNEAYVDAEGHPLPLPRFRSEGGDQSFEALVASVNSDIRSKVVLDEWLRLGIARLDEERRVCLQEAAFVPSEGYDEKAFYLGHNLHDHIAAAAHNLQGIGKPFMERSVHYDALSQESIAQLAKLSLDQGMKALVSVNKSAMAAEQRDSTSSGTRKRMTFGVYFYAEDAPASPTVPSQDPASPEPQQ